MNVKITFSFVRNFENFKVIVTNLHVFESAHAYVSPSLELLV